jgi:hypothetical protein
MGGYLSCHREECFPNGKDDVAFSVVGGNDEIAKSFYGRTRDDRN